MRRLGADDETARRKESDFGHSDTLRVKAYDVNVPFMQLGRHGWDIHAAHDIDQRKPRAADARGPGGHADAAAAGTDSGERPLAALDRRVHRGAGVAGTR